MSSPSQNELLDYIKTAIEIETDLATQEQIMNQCCLDIQHRKPSLQQDALPSMPQVEDTSTQWTGAGYVGIGGGIFIFLILLISVGSYDGGIWVSLLLLAFFAIPGILCIQYGKKREAKVEQQMQAYFEQTQQIQDRNQEKKNTYNSAIRQCNESEEAIRAAIQPGITETKALLEKLYDKNIIYRKYCTLPALTSIYEYFITGRCTELTGPHGAYNLYEDELRKDTVISQLNAVIENLEQIRHNQYMLYQQVKSIQENTSAIASELRQIKGYTVQIAQLTALNAYYAALNERNTRITMYYHL